MQIQHEVLLNDDGTRFSGLQLQTEGIYSCTKTQPILSKKFLIKNDKVYEQLLEVDEEVRKAVEKSGYTYVPLLCQSVKSQIREDTGVKDDAKKYLRVMNVLPLSFQRGLYIIDVGQLVVVNQKAFLQVDVELIRKQEIKWKFPRV